MWAAVFLALIRFLDNQPEWVTAGLLVVLILFGIAAVLHGFH
jgi:hypothetical protein